MADSKPIAFEKTLAELTSIVETMESGDLPLEKALQQFERGVKLTRDCQQAISNAEQHVAILVADTNLQPFDDHDLQNDL